VQGLEAVQVQELEHVEQGEVLESEVLEVEVLKVEAPLDLELYLEWALVVKPDPHSTRVGQDGLQVSQCRDWLDV